MIRINLAKDHQTPEEWRPVPGYEEMGLEVSDCGRLRRYLYYTPQLNTNGYFWVCTHHETKEVHVFLHQAVCSAFNGVKPFDGAVVRHLDGNCQNNSPGNLVWGTHKENAEDRTRHGMTIVGELSPKTKLTENDVAEIRKRAGAGNTELQLAQAYGVSESTISRIVKGDTWKHNDAPTLCDGAARRAYNHRKLTDEQVREIRSTCKCWSDCRVYADLRGISASLVYLAMRGKRRFRSLVGSEI